MHKGEVVDDRFEIDARAGEGGMGTVYRAIDRSNRTTVAFKILHDPQGDAITRFAHEARALADLDDPHIVRYIAHGTLNSGEPYLVVEWVEGESLSEHLARGHISVAESLEIAWQLASALGAAHARGIVHRDVKPSNVMLEGGSSKHVKLLDFGIARLAEATAGLTGTRDVIGTPGYMAPEQARGERAPIDARTDVFSLGCVLYECLAGRPTFVGNHPMALLAKLLFEEPPPLRELAPDVPEGLANLVMRMLSKDQDARPQDGHAITRLLDSLSGRASQHPTMPAKNITAAELFSCRSSP